MSTVQLEPMTDAEFSRFLETILPPYAQERARADHLSLEAAERFARAQQARLLPQGRLSPGHRFFRIVAAESGEEVGGVWLYLDGENHTAFLYNITINPAHRRRGYATAALALIDAITRQAGCQSLGLNVFATNPAAAALYRRLGYAVVSSHMNKVLTSDRA